MKTALIAGATGLVGQALLQKILDSKYYSKLIVLVRNPLDIKHEKLVEYKIDFNTIAELTLDANIDDVFCCLGTTIKTAGSKAAFTKVDYSYVVQLAEWANVHHCQQFSVISSVGASTSTSNFYLKTKGDMEDAVGRLGLPGVHIYRPSLLIGQRNEFRLGEKIAAQLMRISKPLFKGKLRKYQAITAEALAQAMHHKAQLRVKGIYLYEGAEIV